MRRDFRVAKACASEAVRDFRLYEYAPFGLILAAQSIFLALVFTMGTPLGMATAGAIARLVLGDNIHYPTFFLNLPSVSQRVEAFLYALPGSVLIPLSLIRILKPAHPELGDKAVVRSRLKQAFLPALAAALVNAALLEVWQALLRVGPVPIMKAVMPGFAGQAVTWVIAIVVAFAVAALFLYVPILAVQAGVSLRDACVRGFKEGVRLFPHSVFFIFLFSWPALCFLFLTQMRTGFIVGRMRPEILPLLLFGYSLLISVASYLTYAAAMRLHWAEEKEEASA
jgi:hypothetical protein